MEVGVGRKMSAPNLLWVFKLISSVSICLDDFGHKVFTKCTQMSHALFLYCNGIVENRNKIRKLIFLKIEDNSK